MPETSARELIHEIGTAARRASRITACASTEKKNAALERIAQALMTRRDVIQAANAVDLANARSEGLSAAFVDRLAVTDRVLDQMVTGVRQIAELADPVGGIENLRPMPSGIRVGRMRVPLGVIAMIYESRPNVTIDAAALAIKSGNAVMKPLKPIKRWPPLFRKHSPMQRCLLTPSSSSPQPTVPQLVN